MAREYLSQTELCRHLGIYRNTLLRYRRRRRDPLPCRRIGRKVYYELGEVDRWMQREAKRR
jgi:predicted DNA-binding transcriptional regulator AlpA